jgi:hypothetical protein
MLVGCSFAAWFSSAIALSFCPLESSASASVVRDSSCACARSELARRRAPGEQGQAERRNDEKMVITGNKCDFGRNTTIG